MTVLVREGIDMAAVDEQALDALFDQMTVPEGYRAEIVGGAIHMSPQRRVHWEITRRVVRALEDAFCMDALVLSDVRIDFPGPLNGFCPDVAKMRDGAESVRGERWRYQDVEFVTEVISQSTARNDYEPKKRAYAAAAVPVYLIADPYQRRCHVYTEPKEGEYRTELIVAFGGDVDLTSTSLGLTLATKDFPVE
ncbi:Uma2 family endonuclease [Streptomyces abyssomicinicus]|uniref:Uma2 family endonuclease n=1 Tax=Streptomyces abyssomicinicus TaxID=574929 RepID=UPI00124F7B3A|nr:Uma2 family endonuclease [Streptomyces abyssomicinicus]